MTNSLKIDLRQKLNKEMRIQVYAISRFTERLNITVVKCAINNSHSKKISLVIC